MHLNHFCVHFFNEHLVLLLFNSCLQVASLSQASIAPVTDVALQLSNVIMLSHRPQLYGVVRSIVVYLSSQYGTVYSIADLETYVSLMKVGHWCLIKWLGSCRHLQ